MTLTSVEGALAQTPAGWLTLYCRINYFFVSADSIKIVMSPFFLVSTTSKTYKKGANFLFLSLGINCCGINVNIIQKQLYTSILYELLLYNFDNML